MASADRDLVDCWASQPWVVPELDPSRVAVTTGVCERCGAGFSAGARGPAGRYCSGACRQANHRDRARPAPSTTGPDLGPFLDEFEAALVAPGEWWPVGLMRTASELLGAAGREVVVADVDEWPSELQRRVPFRRPREWTGIPLVLQGRSEGKRYRRLIDVNGEWRVTVRSMRRELAKGQPLGRRQHSARHSRAAEQYDYVGRWGIPDVNVLTRLGSAIIADAVDLGGGATGPAARRHKLSLVGAHFAGDVIWPYGDREWTLSSTDIVAWLKVHRYVTNPRS
jgi:hypothetical protein